MKRNIAILVFALCLATQSHAQTFLKDLQQKRQGEGTVTVKQSADIDDLVNSAKLKAGSAQAAHQDDRQKKAPDSAQPLKKEDQSKASNKQNTNERKPVQGDHKGDSATHNKQAQAANETERHTTGAEHKPAQEKIPTKQEKDITEDIDTSKKMMRNSHKVTGYRIQAYSGGNSRADREKANQIGDAIKRKYPEQPVYVHFYSPRWICRIGNFRSYDEAAQLLKGIKAMGYKQACIVKGKITVWN